MSISFQCDQCARWYSVKDALAGKTVKCKDCGARLKIPAQTAHPRKISSYGPHQPHAMASY